MSATLLQKVWDAHTVRVLPNGNIWVGEGVTVIRQGAAQCR